MASIAPPSTEPVEQVSYKAKDWKSVTEDLYRRTRYDSASGHLKDLSHHVWKKADAASNSKGGDFVFGETLTSAEAKAIRQSGQTVGAQEQKGDSR